MLVLRALINLCPCTSAVSIKKITIKLENQQNSTQVLITLMIPLLYYNLTNVQLPMGKQFLKGK